MTRRTIRQRSAPALWFLRILAIILYVIVAFIMVYAVRHMAFTLNRLFGKQRHPYLDIETAEWPRVTYSLPRTTKKQ
jgi:hypothetical protein